MSTAALLEKFKKFPFGLWLFSRAICIKAPYFASIGPTFSVLEDGKVVAHLKKRRSVQNHIGTVHAIAIANLCEFVAGTALEVMTPEAHRWIPKSMKINYIAKATTDLTAKANINIQTWPDAASEIILVEVFDLNNTLVVNAEIEMYITKKK